MPRFVRYQIHARRTAPTEGMKFVIDDVGWFYIYRLLGHPEAGPYLLEELIQTYDLNPEPWRAGDLPQPK